MKSFQEVLTTQTSSHAAACYRQGNRHISQGVRIKDPHGSSHSYGLQSFGIHWRKDII